MVGFKAEAETAEDTTLVDLHSNMVGFKASLHPIFRMIDLIYIPIWWDLKNKHICAIFVWCDIYIPIWWDLKQISNALYAEVIVIYIPIWWDLKCNSNARLCVL